MGSLHLRSHTQETLVDAWPDLDPVLARRIVQRAVGEDRDDLGGLRGLSGAVARKIEERSRTTRLEVVDRRRSAVDPFVKYLFRSSDGQVFETVRIPLLLPR